MHTPRCWQGTNKHLKGKFETPLNDLEVGETGTHSVAVDLARDGPKPLP